MHWDLSDGDREAGRAGGNLTPNRLRFDTKQTSSVSFIAHTATGRRGGRAAPEAGPRRAVPFRSV